MTSDQLAAWIDRRELTQEKAAKILGLTKRGLQDQLYGVHPVSSQTEQLCKLWDAYSGKGEEFGDMF